VADLLQEQERQRTDRFTKKKNIIMLFAVGLIIVAGISALAVLSWYFNNRCYTKYEVENEVERSDSNNVTYSYFNGNILKCSRSGISAMDYNGKSLWNGGFEMKQPQIDTCGEYVVVADIGGKDFYVYNGEDEGTSLETTLPIVRAKVAKQGVVAALLEDTDSNVLNLYDPYRTTDNLLVEIPTNVSDEGYPLDFDISPDGNSVVVAYMVVSGNSIEVKLNFYNFTEVGQDQNTLVGGMSFGDEMISEIGFVGDDEVAVFHEKGFTLFSGMKQPEKLAEQTFDEDIQSMAYNEKYIAVVTGGTEDKKTLILHNLKGREQMKKEISYDFSEMKIYKNEIFLVSNLGCQIIRTNGREKFVCEFEEGIDTIFPTVNGNMYTLLETSAIQKIKLMTK
jgi:hypothetical protein